MSVSPALEMNAFEPFKINLFPSLLAMVDSEAASDPDPGSVKQYDPNFSIEAINGTHFDL